MIILAKCELGKVTFFKNHILILSMRWDTMINVYGVYRFDNISGLLKMLQNLKSLVIYDFLPLSKPVYVYILKMLSNSNISCTFNKKKTV